MRGTWDDLGLHSSVIGLFVPIERGIRLNAMALRSARLLTRFSVPCALRIGGLLQYPCAPETVTLRGFRSVN